MKLYYAPGACSLSPHISLREAGAAFDLERVDTRTRTTESGADYLAINPKGYVPALQLDDGEVLTEGAAVVQFIADRHPAAGLAPANGSLERARLQEHLNFIASELHKAFTPLFDPSAPKAAKQAAPAAVARRLDHFERLLADGRAYLLGERFSVADAYLFTVASWTGPTGIGLDRWPRLAAFVARVAARPAVQAAMQVEGLVAA
ncbi:MAG: glutathione transferase GstA [Reyranella sp.]|nr:MAG: glutathione transferase GstA [Reyranella sp.]